MACGCNQNKINQTDIPNIEQNIVYQKSIDNKNMTLDEMLEQYRQGNAVLLQSMQPLQSTYIQQYEQTDMFQQPTQQTLSSRIKSMANDSDGSLIIGFMISLLGSLAAIYVAKKMLKW